LIFLRYNKMPSVALPPLVNASGKLTVAGATALLAAAVASQRLMKKKRNNKKKSPRRR
jgi:hypothetical protein